MDSWKMKLLLRKISPSEDEKYTNSRTFYRKVETVETLNKCLVNTPHCLMQDSTSSISRNVIQRILRLTQDSSTSNANSLKLQPSQMNNLSV